MLIEDAVQLVKYIGLGFMLLSGIRLISLVSKDIHETEMKRMLIAVVSGVLEGLLICAGLSTGNAAILGIALAFFVWQWIRLGK